MAKMSPSADAGWGEDVAGSGQREQRLAETTEGHCAPPACEQEEGSRAQFRKQHLLWFPCQGPGNCLKF